jgi:alpha-glucosidase
MYAGPGAVLRHWLRPPFSADGWRIDVANMLGRLGPDQLGPEVARGIRTAVKAENPDAYLIGEHSFDGTDQLAGDEWDGVMNYAGFTWPVVGWLNGTVYESHGVGVILRTGRTPTADLIGSLEAFRAAVPWAVARCQYNLLDSHDTARIRTSVGGDPGRVRAAFGMLLAYVGVPSVLYGDEVGLEGSDGLSTRRTMPWDQADWDVDQLAFLRTLIHFRVRSRALMTGGYQVLETGDDSVAFLRDTDEEQVIVVVARGPSRPADPLPVAAGAVADGTAFVELFSGARATAVDGHLDIGATPAGVAIWMAAGLD